MIFRSLLAASLLSAAPLAAQDIGIPLGSTPSASTIQSLDGKPVDLSKWIGKVPLVIEFWATWCGNCRELEPAIFAAAKKHGKQVKFLGIAVSVNQSPGAVKKYAEKHRIPFEVLYDRKGDATEAFEVPATSYVVALDRKGRVVYTGLGGKQDIESAVQKALK
jgi:thiol-disulfide isomerase/thioredoxin